MADMQARFANLRRTMNDIIGDQAENQGNDPPVRVDPVVQPANNPVGVAPYQADQRRFRNFLNRPLVARPVIYDNDVTVATTRTGSLEHWDDLTPGARPGYNLIHYDDNARLVEIGTTVFTSLHGNISVRSICQLMQLAYNLRDRYGDRCFGIVNQALIDQDNNTDFDDIPATTIANTIKINQMTVTINRDEANPDPYNLVVGNAYCYLAATYLRLYTKSAYNFTQIDPHIKDRFKNFFGYEIPFEEFAPTRETINAVKSQFETNTILRNTFYNVIYAGENLETGRQLKDFLYVIHVQFTGMHCYLLFFRCMEELKVRNIELMRALHCTQFTAELGAMRTIFNRFYNTQNEPNMERQMWRFARIFNSNFMNQLQTKNCAFFVAVLAHLLHLMTPTQGNQDARSIARVVQLSHDQLTLAQAVAARTREIIVSTKFRNYWGEDSTKF